MQVLIYSRIILPSVQPNQAQTVSTLPVLTQCQFDGDKNIDMVVVIRDPNNVITTDLATNANDILGVKYGDNQVCNFNAKAKLAYFKVIGFDDLVSIFYLISWFLPTRRCLKYQTISILSYLSKTFIGLWAPSVSLGCCRSEDK